jgi:Flp pilus assembly protein TadG
MQKWRLRHLNNWITNKPKRSGQSLVEFALVSLLLFTLILGILEMGRVMFIYTQIVQAAQEGARYGAVRPREITSGGGYPTASVNVAPCNIIDSARAKVVFLAPTDITVTVGYDNGSSGGAGGSEVYPFCNNPAATCSSSGWRSDPIDFEPLQNRVVVTATYQFHFVTGLIDRFAPNGLTLQMVSARTILAPEENAADMHSTCPDVPQ